VGQSVIVEALMRPEAYDHEVGEVGLVQTHISFVFLAGDYVYKVKKAVNLGFLDFTTLEKRRFFCERELELNRRLCGDMYVEVVPINRSDGIRVKGEGETVEYAVKMRRMPEERMMSRLLEGGEVDEGVIDEIARIVADFHSKAETSGEISRFGSLRVIGANWRENFEQTREFIGRTITPHEFELVREKVNGFMKARVRLFEERAAEGRIRDCHGDIHSGNIFVADRIYIFDAIEFNERFRYSDVASEVAFLAMDLDFKGRADLSTFLVERYVEYSGDRGLTELLPFYKCYRAYVRGKVASFRLNDPHISDDEKAVSMNEARGYFKLAHAYTEKF